MSGSRRIGGAIGDGLTLATDAEVNYREGRSFGVSLRSLPRQPTVLILEGV